MGDSTGTRTVGRPWIVMLSGTPWGAAAHRQHALARELAGAYRVLFVDPPANRSRRGFSVDPVGPSLWHASLPTLLPFGRQLAPVNRIGRRQTARLLGAWLDARPGPRLLWIDEDLAAPLIGQLAETNVVYDATDLDWTFTRRWNRTHLRGALARAVGAADLVLASSSALPARLPATRVAAVVVPNACDPAMFSAEGPLHPLLAALPRPILGYLGAIDTRAFDGALVAAVASAHPEWTFALVGPATPAGLAPLRGLANVHRFDAAPFADTPAIMRSFDVGLIPYRVGGRIDYVHPKKCFEYLAAGLPVVATPLPALTTLDAPLRLAATPATFADAIADGLDRRHDPIESGERRRVAISNSWTARGVQVRGLLADLLEGTHPRGRRDAEIAAGAVCEDAA